MRSLQWVTYGDATRLKNPLRTLTHHWLVLDLVCGARLAASAAEQARGVSYNYGNGSYYEGFVDNWGRPSGHGKFYSNQVTKSISQFPSGQMEADVNFLACRMARVFFCHVRNVLYRGGNL